VRRLARSLAETSTLIDDATGRLVARGEGAWLTAAHVATAVACSGLGRYDDALVAAEGGTAANAPKSWGLLHGP
jgi:hypothetical protein